MDEIAIGCSYLCSGSIGDRIKVLFKIYDLNDNNMISYEELYKYFHSTFTICFISRNDISFDIDVDKLAKETAKNCIKYTITELRKQTIDIEKGCKYIKLI